MRRFQVEQALENGQQLDGDWRAAHLEDTVAFNHSKAVNQAGLKQSLLTLPWHGCATHVRAYLLY